MNVNLIADDRTLKIPAKFQRSFTHRPDNNDSNTRTVGTEVSSHLSTSRANGQRTLNLFPFCQPISNVSYPSTCLFNQIYSEEANQTLHIAHEYESQNYCNSFVQKKNLTHILFTSRNRKLHSGTLA